MFKFLKRIFSPSVNEELWTITEEMINQHGKVYINFCRYYNEDKSKSIEVNPQGLLKYRLLGASFPSSAYRFALCKDKPELSFKFEKKAVAMATKPFSSDSKQPYLLDAVLTASIAEHIFPLAQGLIAEEFELTSPLMNLKSLHAMHFAALHESIKDRDYLDGKKALIAGHITAPMAFVSEMLESGF